MIFEFEPIGVMETCFKEKFGIPRQSGLVKEARGVLKLRPDAHYRRALLGLEGFSHIWVLFVFHRHDSKNWKPSVRPPRLGGSKKMGVFATRAPHRPNPIGISVVKLDRIAWDAKNGIELHLSGVDILDGTPILDIKPYIPYADSLPRATSGWVKEKIHKRRVIFTKKALEQISEKECESFPHLKKLITEVLSLDPRPAFQSREADADLPTSYGRRYGFSILDLDVKWEIIKDAFRVVGIETLEKTGN